MSLPPSGICFHADATNGRQHHLGAGLTIEGPFTSLQLVLRFPRWVPGSYFLREPIQHMFDFSAISHSIWRKIVQNPSELTFVVTMHLPTPRRPDVLATCSTDSAVLLWDIRTPTMRGPVQSLSKVRPDALGRRC